MGTYLRDDDLIQRVLEQRRRRQVQPCDNGGEESGGEEESEVSGRGAAGDRGGPIEGEATAGRSAAPQATGQHRTAQRVQRRRRRSGAPSMRKGTRSTKSVGESRALPLPASVTTSSSPCRQSVITAAAAAAEGG